MLRIVGFFLCVLAACGDDLAAITAPSATVPPAAPLSTPEVCQTKIPSLSTEGLSYEYVWNSLTARIVPCRRDVVEVVANFCEEPYQFIYIDWREGYFEIYFFDHGYLTAIKTGDALLTACRHQEQWIGKPVDCNPHPAQEQTTFCIK